MSERYQVLVETYAEGGFGRVGKHRDLILDRLVAVKHVTRPSDAAAARLAREARTLARLSHPNIPTIYDVQADAAGVRIYCEFIEGNTLRSLIETGSLPSVEEARRWFCQIASALECAHSVNVIHRDVKPDNIIVSMDRRTAVLVDFGIALSTDEPGSATEQEYLLGTPRYLSPEQREGRALGPAADLFSLGMTFYEALAGHPPRPARYRSLSRMNEAIPVGFDEIIRACLVADPIGRLSSAAEFVRRLRRVRPYGHLPSTRSASPTV